jgi:hypothetical protein
MSETERKRAIDMAQAPRAPIAKVADMPPHSPPGALGALPGQPAGASAWLDGEALLGLAILIFVMSLYTALVFSRAQPEPTRLRAASADAVDAKAAADATVSPEQ